MDERDRRTHWRYHDRNEVEDAILVPKAEAVRKIIRAIRSGARPLERPERALP